MTRLSPKDFEQLIDLILARTGWERISTLGGTREGIDLEAENPAADEIAFVQVKSSASQEVLNRYVERFDRERDRYARMIFAVHTPSGKLDRLKRHLNIRSAHGHLLAGSGYSSIVKCNPTL